MPVPDSLVLASEVIGFLSFAFTLLTAIGVYADLIKTLRGAPATIPITLGNLREEIKYESALCNQKLGEGDPFHVFPARKPRKGARQDLQNLALETLRHLWIEFCNIEKQFLVRGEKQSSNLDDDDENSSDEKTGSRRRRNTRPKPANRQSYIRGRMGWVEAGLARDRQTYYNVDLTHRFVWWWKKDDVENLAKQVQRLQIQRIERSSYESNELVKRALKLYGRVSGDDVYDSSSDGNEYSRRDGPGSDGGGGPRGGASHRRRRSGTSRSHMNGRRSRNNAAASKVREVSEKEVIRRRVPSPEHATPTRRSMSLADSRRERPRRGSVVYEYEVVDPGRIHVEYGNPRQDQMWQEGRQRSYSRPRDRD